MSELTSKEILAKEFDSLRGRLCSVIESAGLPPKQEEALIILIKTMSYQSQSVISELLNRLDNDSVLFTYNTAMLNELH